jgi:hypothetical protein
MRVLLLEAGSDPAGEPPGHCRHRPLWRFLQKLGFDPTRHGWSGWLPSERAKPLEAFRDKVLLRMVILSAWSVQSSISVSR